MKYIVLPIIGLAALFTAGCARVVTSGRHTVKRGTTIPGSLIITSGQIVLEKESLVGGSVIMTSGSLSVYGEVDGNIFMSSGQVYIGPEAVVHGSIRGTSGTVEQAEGARVLGKVVTNFGESVSKFLVLAGAALYFVATGRRLVQKEKEPTDWQEKQIEKSKII